MARAQRGPPAPPTAFEPGFWECQVDGGCWVPYTWPSSSIIEQAFCRGRSTAEFVKSGVSYRVELPGGLPAPPAGFRATQVNVRTGFRREVRRWPSEQEKSALLERQRAGAMAAWGAWLQADWGWVLLDPSEDAAVRKQGNVPSVLEPPQKPYSLGDGCTFSEPWWPDPMRAWPSCGLASAAHPSGHRCNFALKRLMAESSASDGVEREWAALCGLWQRRGLGCKRRLLGAYRVQNRGLLHGFAATRQVLLSRLAGEGFADGVGREAGLGVRLLWHGTRSVDGLLEICREGFDRARAQTCVYGKGCYFATSAVYSDRYACAIRVPGVEKGMRAMLLAAVLIGETVQGTTNMYPPPVKPHSSVGERYENAVDKVSDPSIFVTFKDHQAVPAYVMIYDGDSLA